MQKMGRKFPANPCVALVFLSASWLVVHCGPVVFAQSQSNPPRGDKTHIELPGNPKPAPPPQRRLPEGEDFGESDLRRKKQLREQREKKLQPPEPSRSEQKEKALIAEEQKERPMHMFMEVSLVRPGIKVSGKRDHYSLDLTNHFQFFMRGNKNEPANKAQFWWGIRLAPFSGSGVYEKIPGRFGFLYFGPMVGLGKFDTLRDTLGDSPRDGDAEKNQLHVRHGWLVTSGIAAQSRIGDASRDEKKLSEDLNSKKFGLDGTGLWMEFRYISIHYGALGFNAFAGGQAGKEKYFYWGGLGVAGWY